MSPRVRGVLKLGALLAILALASLVFRRMPIGELTTLEGIRAWRATVQEAWWGSLAFLAFYSVFAALDFSGVVLTFLGGVLFGFWRGALLNTIGANLGANAAFWLARLWGRDGLRALVGERLSRLDRLAQADGAVWLFRLRLIPIVPFNLLNLAAGLTAMRWRDYAIATAIGILPATLVYTYFAGAMTSGAVGDSRGAFLRALGAGLLLVVLSFAPRIARRTRWLGPTND